MLKQHVIHRAFIKIICVVSEKNLHKTLHETKTFLQRFIPTQGLITIPQTRRGCYETAQEYVVQNTTTPTLCCGNDALGLIKLLGLVHLSP